MKIRAAFVLGALAIIGTLAGPATAKPSVPPPPIRPAINTCDIAWLYLWPSDSALPARAHFPPARAGEQFELLGIDHFTLEGHGYYETTIPVMATSNTAAHYWISDACVNPPPFRSAPSPSATSASRT